MLKTQHKFKHNEIVHYLKGQAGIRGALRNEKGKAIFFLRTTELEGTQQDKTFSHCQALQMFHHCAGRVIIEGDSTNAIKCAKEIGEALGG